MTATALILGLIVGLVAGGAGGAVFARRAWTELLAERQANAAASAEATARETQLRVELAEATASAATDEQMLAAFKSVSSEALAQQSQQLVQLAEAKYVTLQTSTDSVLTKHGDHVAEGLKHLEGRLTSLERERNASVVQMRTMVEHLSQLTSATRDEAARLASAMSDNRVRGAWGEVQLRRALEMAGLDRHVDFVEQKGSSDDSTAGRPDVVVSLPNDRCIVIDSKVPLNRYLEAVSETDPARERALQVEHAKAVASHVKILADRSYTGLVPGSVDLVLLFLPGEPFLSAALDADPALFESAAAKGVYLVTPSSLIPLLRGVALGWRERQAEEAAAEIHQLGIELHERIATFADHYARVGAQLGKTVDAFNSSVGSLETRVVSTARKLSERGAASVKPLPEVVELEQTPRRFRTLSVGEATVGVIQAGVGAGDQQAADVL